MPNTPERHLAQQEKFPRVLSRPLPRAARARSPDVLRTIINPLDLARPPRIRSQELIDHFYGAENMAATLIVKITHGTDIRRFTIPSETLTWAMLGKRVADSFDLASKPFKLTYVDDENDRITLSSDEELVEAIGLARLASPPVLRLSVHVKKSKEAEGHGEATKKEVKEPTLPEGAAELAPFIDSLVKQLPAAMASLPAALKNFIPNAELDVAATIAANQAACQAARLGADRFCPPFPHNAHAKPGVHEGVTCDKSGMSPIVGDRYHLVGHNYDLCEAEWRKLTAPEQAKFRKVAPPPEGAAAAAAAAAMARAKASGKQPEAEVQAPKRDERDLGTQVEEAISKGIHPGVECDRSGQCPIVGTRYNLRGHNFDLCQAEFDKIPSAERPLYEAIPPLVQGPFGPGFTNAFAAAGGPAAMAAAAAQVGQMGMGGPWRPGHCGWRARGHGGHHHGGMHGGNMHGGHGEGWGGKLAARFVRDVTIFDGTQMPAGTTFTKIWRLKNVGEVAWPPGTKMLFVGGDQMTTEMSVPLSREAAVQPGEEVDVAVEMTAPAEHGRYLGYWRLTGPHGRRKFGQRVWCHIQVVDPSNPPTSFEDMDATLAEIESKKTALAATEEDAEADAADAATEAEVKQSEAAEMEAVKVAEAAKATEAAAMKAAEAAAAAAAKAQVEAMKAAEMAAIKAMAPPPPPPAPAPVPVPVPAQVIAVVDDKKDGEMSDDGVLIDADTAAEAVAAEALAASPKVTPKAAQPEPGPSGAAPAGTDTKSELLAMGFVDHALVKAVVLKNGDDLDACARDLAAASEWEPLLDDLAEMGFTNAELNTALMLKNGGNIKRTVKDLVEA